MAMNKTEQWRMEDLENRLNREIRYSQRRIKELTLLKRELELVYDHFKVSDEQKDQFRKQALLG